MSCTDISSNWFDSLRKSIFGTSMSSNITFSVKFGHDKIELCLEPATTVGELKHILEGKTKVQGDLQKLVFKGHTLTDNSVPLSALGLKSGAGMMLVATKPAENPVAKRKLNDVSNEIERCTADLHNIENKIRELQKEFLVGDQRNQVASALKKECLMVGERLMRQLEACDAVDCSGAEEELLKRMRKTNVTRIHTLHDKVDELKAEL
eukprot:Colp12_sorted_trinity150504_noHs@33610